MSTTATASDRGSATAEFAHTPERQPDGVIEALREARDAAREARDDADAAFHSLAALIARSAIKGYEWPSEWTDEFHEAEKARDAAREALQAARVEWYHSIGKHAHGYSPDLCCGHATPSEAADCG